MKAISVENLGKKYKEVQAIKSLTFDVNKGEIFGFLGPNGAGKTTTIKILTTQLRPTSGTAAVLGNDVVENPAAIRERIGVVFEEQNIYPRLTVFQNLKFFAQLYGLENKRVYEVLEFVQLSHRAKDQADKLSRGLKQRIIIARALLTDPDLIFMDEPTSGLDPHIARNIRNMVKGLSDRGKTIFLTTHYMEEADELCHRVAIINEGNIVKLDTPARLKENIGSTELQITIFDNENNCEITERYSANSPKMSMRIKELIDGGTRFKIDSKRVSLEDVFISLTGSSLD